jgi:exopolysaccharide production protein ExoQ
MTVAGGYAKPSFYRFARDRRPGFIGAGRLLAQSNGKSSPLVWIVVVFLLIIQQGAFIDMPALSDSSTTGGPADVNTLNTVGVAISFAAMGVLFLFNARKIGFLASKNVLSLIYIVLALISFAWSIHPDLTIRRALGYVLSMSIAAYLTVRFNDVERMKLISASFAISAIGSFLYVAAYPDQGIMQIGDLAGTWRGVFPHKNVLGPVMAVGFFAELYVLVASRGRPRWRFILLGLYFALVALSRSVTALLMSAAFLAATCLYLQWKSDHLLAIVTGLIVLLLALLATFVLWVDPEFALGLLGKDVGLTGRTELWDAVVGLIKDRPVLGYGYRAMWSQSDPYWILTNELVGGWGVGSSHNAFLEITLELGAVGLSIILAIVSVALYVSLQCCRRGIVLLGWFSFVFFATTIFAGQAGETLGLNQNIFWLVFTVMFLSCGMSLWPQGIQRARSAARPNPLLGGVR